MVENQPVESTPLAQEPKVEVTKETVPPAKTFTEDEINRIVKERLDRERKKYSDYEDLKSAKAKLDEIEMATKTREEQAMIKLKALEEKLAEQDKLVKAAELKERKRAALEAAQLSLPKDVTAHELLDMIHGESDEEISATIDKFKKLFPASKAQGLGTQVTEPVKSGKKTIDDRLSEIKLQIREKGLDNRTREDLAREMLRLTNKKMRGDV